MLGTLRTGSDYPAGHHQAILPGGTNVTLADAIWEEHIDQHFGPVCNHPTIGGSAPMTNGAEGCAAMCLAAADCTGFHARNGMGCQFCTDSLSDQHVRSSSGINTYYKTASVGFYTN
jgi:hypothetical protein